MEQKISWHFFWGMMYTDRINKQLMLKVAGKLYLWLQESQFVNFHL